MAVLGPDPGFWSVTSYKQLGYGIWVNLSTLALGLAHGFPAIHIPQLKDPDCDILVSVHEMSWIASILILFSPIGCLLSGFLLDKYGRQPVIVISELPMCIGWIYTAFSDKATHIIIGRAITGVGVGMAMSAPRLYTTEISLPNMRGVLGAFPSMFISLGMTIQAAMGSYLEWETISLICGVYNACLLLSYLLLGETPHYLLLRGFEQKARKALVRFRAKSYDVDLELDELIMFKTDNKIHTYWIAQPFFYDQFISRLFPYGHFADKHFYLSLSSTGLSNFLSFKEKIGAMFTYSCCKPFTILMIYVAIGVLAGFSIVIFWTVELLKLSKSSFDAYSGNIAINATRLVFGLITSILLYHVGRNTLSVISATGVGIACIALGLNIRYNNEATIFPQLILMTYIAFATLGFFCIPDLLMSELYPLQVRGMVMGISISLASGMIFASAKSFPYLRDSIGVSNSFFIFGTCSLLGALFLFFFLPETKGLTLQEIEEYFNARRRTLISERSIRLAQLDASLDSGNTKSNKEHFKQIIKALKPVTLPKKSSLKSASSHVMGIKKSVSFSDPPSQSSNYKVA